MLALVSKTRHLRVPIIHNYIVYCFLSTVLEHEKFIVAEINLGRDTLSVKTQVQLPCFVEELVSLKIQRGKVWQ